MAPRDVVSRAILKEMVLTGATCAYLDVRHIPGSVFRQRFPRITELCREFDIDVTSDLIPVRPSAHYMIGGVVTDDCGRTSVDSLLACGEVACTGVHGANRLASNSLLEGMVYGRLSGQAALEAVARMPASPRPLALKSEIAPSTRTELDVVDVRNSLRSVAWRNAGIERDGDRLAETIDILHFWGRYVMDKVFDEQFAWETQNMLTVVRLVATAARLRTESRGVHYRRDFPERDDKCKDTPARKCFPPIQDILAGTMWTLTQTTLNPMVPGTELTILFGQIYRKRNGYGASPWEKWRKPIPWPV